MNIKNRMANVVDLRDHACQDLLMMLLPDDWKDKLYEFASNSVKKNSNYDPYKKAYDDINNLGIDKYSVSEMDVPLINSIAHTRKICTTSERIRHLLENVNKDRRLTSHANSNETPQKLYIWALIALENLKDLVCNAYNENKDKDEELLISADAYLKYRKKYYNRIIDEQTLILEECADAIGFEKWVEKTISNCLECKDTEKRDLMFSEEYGNTFKKKNPFFLNITIQEQNDRRLILLKKGSAAGIPDAHYLYLFELLSLSEKDDSVLSTAVKELVLCVKSGYGSKSVFERRELERTTEKLLSCLIENGKEIESYPELIEVLKENDIDYSIIDGSVLVQDKRKS